LGRSRRRPESPGACCVRRSSWRRRQAALRYRVGSRGCKPVGRPLSLPIVEKRIREALAAPRRPRCDCQTVRRGSRDIHFESASRSPRLSCASERTKLFGASRDLAIPRSAAPHDRWHVRSTEGLSAFMVTPLQDHCARAGRNSTIFQSLSPRGRGRKSAGRGASARGDHGP
jgi:hypothetical protein